MKPNDAAKFYQGLKTLEVFFRDTLTEDHEILYWETMRDACTIEEWQGACVLAMRGETFHVVPLPGIMQRYIDVVREEYREVRAEQERLATATRKQLYAAEQQAVHRKRQQDALVQLEASQAKLAALWGEEWLAQHKRMMDPNTVDKETN